MEQNKEKEGNSMNMNEFSVDFVSYLLTQIHDVEEFLRDHRHKTLEDYLVEETPKTYHIKLGFLKSGNIDYRKGYHHVYHEMYGKKIPEEYLTCSLAFLVNVGMGQMELEGKEAMEATIEDIYLDEAKHQYALLTMAYRHQYDCDIPKALDDMSFERLFRLVKRYGVEEKSLTLLSEQNIICLTETQKEKIRQFFHQNVK